MPPEGVEVEKTQASDSPMTETSIILGTRCFENRFFQYDGTIFDVAVYDSTTFGVGLAEPPFTIAVYGFQSLRAGSFLGIYIFKENSEYQLSQTLSYSPT